LPSNGSAGRDEANRDSGSAPVRGINKGAGQKRFAVIKAHSGAVTIVGVMLAFSSSAVAQRVPPDVVVSNPQVYEVTITTKLVVPANGKTLTGLGVWHALPNARPWDGLERTMGASAITFQPDGGRLQHLSTNESQNVFWEMREGLNTGKKLEFVSNFRVRSVDRTYDLKRSTARWSDYHRNIDVVTPRVDVNLDSIVDDIKRTHPPAEAALEFCRWVTEHIKYDASVPYGSRDLAATLQQQKGHCGHQMTTFEAMCVRAGIPTRTVVGLNLNTPGGVGPLHEIRPDFQNQHTWAQIYLPGSGWVEIDPGMGAMAYSFPAQVIQNSTDFQNYVIWIRENGAWRIPEWEYRAGKWYSLYGIENHRTFRKVERPSQPASARAREPAGGDGRAEAGA
jgi:transglutaminase-like putative cysteine protease